MKKYSYILYLFLVFNLCLCHSQIEQIEFSEKINNQKTDKHKRIKGTRIFIKYPDSYNYQINLTRIQKKEQQYLQFFETESLNFTEVKKENYTKSELEKKGVKYEDIQPIMLQNYEGIFSIGPSKDPTEEKIVMSFGDESFYVLIGGVINKNNKAGKRELVEILKTIYFDEAYQLDPLELVNFEVDLSITDFRYNGNFSNFYAFSKDSINLLKEEDITVNNFMIASLPKMEVQDLEKIAKDLLFRMEVEEVFLFIENKDFKEVVLNGKKSIVLETNLELEEKDGALYLAAIIGDNSSIFFLGSTFKNVEIMKELYKETVAKITFKEE